MKARDFCERLFWTALAATGGNLTAAALFDLSAWKMAAATGLVAAIQCVSVFARWRLSVLPNPGQMFEQT
jgi:hypothetical protein